MLKFTDFAVNAHFAVSVFKRVGCTRIMNYVCEYCNTSFVRAYNLKQHQQKAKYCLSLRKKDVQKYTCQHCTREFTRKDSLKRHQDSCNNGIDSNKVAKIEQDMSEIKLLINSLIYKVNTEQTQLGNVNNRNVLVANLQPVVEQDIQALAIEYLTINDIKKGVEGLVTFVLNYPLGKSLVCTDKSRKKFQYKDADGTLVNDIGGIKLSQTIFKAINPHNQALIKHEYDNIHEQVQDIVSRGAAHDENVSELMMEAMRIQTLGTKCDEIAQGGDNDVRTDFVNRLSKQL